MSASTPDAGAVDALRAQFHARLADATSDGSLKALNDEFLSRKSGSLTALLKPLGSLPVEEKKAFGAAVNALKNEIESALDEKRTALAAPRRPAGAVDVTLPGRRLPIGRVHPLMRVRR